MKLLPHKSEYEPIVAMMESDEYETAEDLAKAIIKHAYEKLLERDWFLTVARLDPIPDGPVQIVYGLSAYESDAKRLELGGPFPRMILPVRSAAGHINTMTAMQTPAVKTFVAPVRRAKKTRSTT